MLYIHHATILTPAQPLTDGVLLADGSRIIAVGSSSAVPCPPQAQVVDAQGLLVAPGFLDLQVNGAFGRDFTANPTTIWEVGAGLVQYGVTAFLPTIVTSPGET